MALALLCRHAQWSLVNENDRRAQSSAVRFARNGVDVLPRGALDLRAAMALAMDEA